MKRLFEKLHDIWESPAREYSFLIISALSLIIGFAFPSLLPFDSSWVAILLCGIPILYEAAEGLVTRFDVKADLLVAIALVASVAIGEIFAAGEVAFIMQLGELLEDISRRRAHAGIERLLKLKPLTARVVRNGEAVTIPAEEVAVGDTVRVFEGETVPADGEIITGEAWLDTSALSGESLPASAVVGSEISCGTVVVQGSADIRASRVNSDTGFARMIELVKSADAGKSPIVRLTDRFATIITVSALVIAAAAYIITGDIIRAVSVLVVFCPCALVIATPAAVMAAMGNASSRGALVRDGGALERLSSVGRVHFDKTGTLSEARLALGDFECGGRDENALLSLLAAAEARSKHPLGIAICEYAKSHGITPASDVSDFVSTAGRGVSATVNGKKIIAGNAAMIEEAGIRTDTLSEAARACASRGAAIVFMAVDGELCAFAAMYDTLRENARGVVADLASHGVDCMLVSGDSKEAVGYAAAATGISEYRAHATPENKLEIIRDMQKGGKRVAMVGDGINDAPALKAADVGISMGGVGSDIAIESSDIALVGDNIDRLPCLIDLSRKMTSTIKINITFSLALNLIAVALAAAGLLGPVAGALVHNIGSVLVVVNSVLLLKYTPRSNIKAKVRRAELQ